MQLKIIFPVIIAVGALTARYFYPNAFSFLTFALGTVLKVNMWTAADGREATCLAYVKEHAKRGDAADVLKKIDDFGWNEGFLMNVGDAKGEILSAALQDKSPLHVLEVGAYVGYSATRIASGLQAGAHLTSVEFSSENAATARQMVDHAGLSHKVDFIEGTVTTVLKDYMKRMGVPAFDFVFIDHDKSHYLSDLKYMLENDMLAEGAVVVGDNILFPGAPDYRIFVNSDPRFRTVEHMSHVEYLPLPDIVTVSEYLGGSSSSSKQ